MAATRSLGADLRALGCFAWCAPMAALLVFTLCGPRRGLWFARVYAYFRLWDDRVDVPIPAREPAARAVRAERARRAAHGAPTAWPEVALDGALRAAPDLEGPVGSMWAALEADATRPDAPMPAAWLDAQRARIGDAYADALWVCAGQGGPAPEPARRLSRAATRAHHVRDLSADLALGYVNASREDCAALGIDERARDAAAYAAWARQQAERSSRDLSARRTGLRGLPWRARWLLGAMGWRYHRLARALSPRSPRPAR